MVDKKQKIIAEDALLFEHIWKTGKGFYVWVSILTALVLWGIYAYVTQYLNGLTVTGLSRQIFWGVYITNFVFFIGISHAGTFISAVLRVLKAEWRRPISRLSELTTVFILMFGVGSVLIDLGRPDRMLYAIRYAHFTSPLLWDVCSITMYLTVSSICLYLALIPDIALLRDLGGKREWFYRILALGWTGDEHQRRRLDKAIGGMSILVIPVMITVHTVVSFVFVMTIQPLWHSAIFGPYFVVGAIFSGVASVIVVMAIIRKVYHLETYIKPVHFNNIGIFLMAMTLLWFYFTFAEYITVVYGNEPVHMAIFWSKISGKFAPLFWLHFTLCFVIPLPILVAKKFRTIRGTVTASISIIIGMWLERFVIIVPTLTRQRMPVEGAFYIPTWVEWSILAGCISLFALLYTLFTKVFPIVPVWEIREGREKAVKVVSDRIKSYLPEQGTS
ncbi:MAG: NrfD/PsrC family molybdoenzyme membrane anchor subunit [Thermodesulfobacteriota bacterium]